MKTNMNSKLSGAQGRKRRAREKADAEKSSELLAAFLIKKTKTEAEHISPNGSETTDSLDEGDSDDTKNDNDNDIDSESEYDEVYTQHGNHATGK